MRRTLTLANSRMNFRLLSVTAGSTAVMIYSLLFTYTTQLHVVRAGSLRRLFGIERLEFVPNFSYGSLKTTCEWPEQDSWITNHSWGIPEFSALQTPRTGAWWLGIASSDFLAAWSRIPHMEIGNVQIKRVDLPTTDNLFIQNSILPTFRLESHLHKPSKSPLIGVWLRLTSRIQQSPFKFVDLDILRTGNGQYRIDQPKIHISLDFALRKTLRSRQAAIRHKESTAPRKALTQHPIPKRWAHTEQCQAELTMKWGRITKYTSTLEVQREGSRRRRLILGSLVLMRDRFIDG